MAQGEDAFLLVGLHESLQVGGEGRGRSRTGGEGGEHWAGEGGGEGGEGRRRGGVGREHWE